MQQLSIATLSLAGIVLISGCSGGGGSTPPAASSGGATTAPTLAATPKPTAAPSQAASSTLSTATLDGGAAFVTASGFAVYILGSDTNDDSHCTSGCLAVWPAVKPPAGALTSGFTSFTRSDNGQTQLAFNGFPLYTYSNDTSAGAANGNGAEGFSLARPSTAAAPAAATATPTAAPTAIQAPTSTPAPGATATPTVKPTSAPTTAPTPYEPPGY